MYEESFIVGPYGASFYHYDEVTEEGYIGTTCHVFRDGRRLTSSPTWLHPNDYYNAGVGRNLSLFYALLELGDRVHPDMIWRGYEEVFGDTYLWQEHEDLIGARRRAYAEAN